MTLAMAQLTDECAEGKESPPTKNRPGLVPVKGRSRPAAYLKISVSAKCSDRGLSGQDSGFAFLIVVVDVA